MKLVPHTKRALSKIHAALFFSMRRKLSALLAVCLAVLLVFSLVSRSASAAATVDTSISSEATSFNHQRKTWHDGTRYWAAFFSGTEIEFWYSTDGNSWTQNTSATIAVATSDFSIEADGTNAFIVYASADGSVFDVNVRKATSYPGTAFSWGSNTLLYDGFSEIDTDTSFRYVTIDKTTDNLIIITAYKSFYDASTGQMTKELYVARSSAANNISAFDAADILDTNINGGDFVGTASPLAGGEMYAVWAEGTAIEGKKYSAGSWAGSATSIGTLGSGSPQILSNTAADEIYMVYTNSSGNVMFQEYVDGSGWQTAVTLDSNSGNGPAVLARNTSTDEIHAFWIRSSIIYYKKGVSSYLSSDWDTSATLFEGSGSNREISSGKFNTGGAFAIWNEGVSSPYNIKFSTVVSNNPPSTPSLTSPSSGATGVSSSPQFQLSTTDTESDYLRYEIVIYQSDCSTLVRTIDQTSSQTGWSGQDAQTSTAYASGTTASHTYQTPVLFSGTTYCWKARATDPGGSNSWSAYSATQTFTTASTGSAPSAPTLIDPAANATKVRGYPYFKMRATDPDNDQLVYKIEICTTSDCNPGNHFWVADQSLSQNSWSSQDQAGGTAYTGSSSINGSTVAAYTLTTQSRALSANTQYWWRAYAKDPYGSGAFGPASAIQSFTIDDVQNVIILGGSEIRGGGHIR